tara:strand:- start:902 stop:1879 length:978 start_codon:yes stop_codon:yes gene_type:complete
MNTFNKIDELKKKYDEILNFVISKTDNEKIKCFKESYSNDDLHDIISKFCNILEADIKIFKLFLNRNPRVFRNKTNLIIIPDFNIKSYLMDEKSYLWECIQLLYAINRTGNEKFKSNVNKIVESIESYNLGQPNECIDNNVDKMVMDIADTLRNNMVNASKETQKVNPIENMIKTSEMISKKYGNKLKNGQISMNDMFESLGRMMGEIDKKTTNDEDLKKVEMDDLPNPESMMNELGIDTKDFNPMDMISQMLNKKKEQEELTEEQIKEMEEFYSSVSTKDLLSDIKPNDTLEKFNENLMNQIPNNKKDELQNITNKLINSLTKN